MAKIQSVEPNIADLANGWLKSYKRDYKLEQESLNTEIDQALNDYYSKNGGVGGNRPDAKLLLQDKNLVNYPILIEYKGYKDLFSVQLRLILQAQHTASAAVKLSVILGKMYFYESNNHALCRFGEQAAARLKICSPSGRSMVSMESAACSFCACWGWQ